MGDYTHKSWQCPFYSGNSKLRIRCEGAQLRYRDKQAMDEYAARYCANRANGWHDCSVACGLLEYYSREEDDGG